MSIQLKKVDELLKIISEVKDNLFRYIHTLNYVVGKSLVCDPKTKDIDVVNNTRLNHLIKEMEDKYYELVRDERLNNETS